VDRFLRGSSCDAVDVVAPAVGPEPIRPAPQFDEGVERIAPGPRRRSVLCLGPTASIAHFMPDGQHSPLLLGKGDQRLAMLHGQAHWLSISKCRPDSENGPGNLEMKMRRRTTRRRQGPPERADRDSRRRGDRRGDPGGALASGIRPRRNRDQQGARIGGDDRAWWIPRRRNRSDRSGAWLPSFVEWPGTRFPLLARS